MAKMIHSMIRVSDLDRSIRYYQQTLNLHPAGRFDMEDFSLVYLRNEESEFELELTFNRDAEEPYSHGSGYGHLAVSVEDARSFHAQMQEQGFNPTELKEFGQGEQIMARFFFLTDPDGYKIEVLERLGRFQ
ncbi:VOC family protein [Neptuniibacter halophilus]|uniref:VOC family protein n=1 Tax=Neptuniibacter halophilus TaxID=651666 RepID=UPI0025725D2D|nr:VOC family protein [Neptuniibacter halophilus]